MHDGAPAPECEEEEEGFPKGIPSLLLDPVFPDAGHAHSHLCTYLKAALTTLQRKSHLCIPFLGIARPQYQFPHSYVCGGFIYSQDRSTYSLQQNRQTDPNWKAEHYYTVLEITVSFLGVHKWEPDIDIGFSPALHLQCTSRQSYAILYLISE